MLRFPILKDSVVQDLSGKVFQMSSHTAVPGKVSHSFEGTDETQITASAGEILSVIGDYDDGWCEVKKSDRQGIFPTAYLSFPSGMPQKIIEETADLVSMGGDSGSDKNTENINGFNFESDPTWEGFEDTVFDNHMTNVQSENRNTTDLMTTSNDQVEYNEVYQEKPTENDDVIDVEGVPLDEEAKGSELKTGEDNRMGAMFSDFSQIEKERESFSGATNKISEPVQVDNYSLISSSQENDLIQDLKSQLKLAQSRISDFEQSLERRDQELSEKVDQLNKIRQKQMEESVQKMKSSSEVDGIKAEIKKQKEMFSQRDQRMKAAFAEKLKSLEHKFKSQEDNFKMKENLLKEKCKEKIKEYTLKEREANTKMRNINERLSKENEASKEYISKIKSNFSECYKTLQQHKKENGELKTRTEQLLKHVGAMENKTTEVSKKLGEENKLKAHNQQLQEKLLTAKDFFAKAKSEFQLKNREALRLKAENDKLKVLLKQAQHTIRQQQNTVKLPEATAVPPQVKAQAKSPTKQSSGSTETMRKRTTSQPRPTAPGTVKLSDPFAFLHL